MSKDKKEILHNMVNSSGFLFQLAVESEVRRTEANHKWKVLFREYPWADAKSDREGFIDIVLSLDSTERLIIECKRSLDASWIFLAPEGSSKNMRRVRCLWSDSKVNEEDLAGWYDSEIHPESYESDFCIIRGQGEGDMSMLERLSRNLLNSMECFMTEELRITRNRNIDDKLIYYPVIVTSAQLQVCHFNPSKISLENGKLDDADYESVPFIRFRKSFATWPLHNSTLRDIGEAYKERTRSVLIINASEFTKILANWNRQDVEWPGKIDRENRKSLPQ